MPQKIQALLLETSQLQKGIQKKILNQLLPLSKTVADPLTLNLVQFTIPFAVCNKLLIRRDKLSRSAMDDRVGELLRSPVVKLLQKRMRSNAWH